ncbi:FHA domain-containing protein [Dulcicalothrix desertica]|uniref:FHA domain-containing protein n=1 Tax=Dulcicalothrix desertica TaxID=32056 RepID=UPI00119A3808|nr:FHA domain-containing protein [Dulcicalothrix desertica]TWH51313.1 FOG: FHA domain [Dulcicalothrix desertica PCC 7102]
MAPTYLLRSLNESTSALPTSLPEFNKSFPVASLRLLFDSDKQLLSTPVTRIGRTTDNNIIIPDLLVSRQHAQIICRDSFIDTKLEQNYYLRDDSTAGTLIYQSGTWQRIHHEEVRLQSGMQLKFGSSRSDTWEFIIEENLENTVLHVPVTQVNQIDEEQSVRKNLASGSQEKPNILEILKHSVKSEDSLYLRLTAVQNIAKHWKDDSDLPRLENHISNLQKLIDIIYSNQTFVTSQIKSVLALQIQEETVAVDITTADGLDEAEITDVEDIIKIVFKLEEVKLDGENKFIIPFSLKVKCTLSYFMMREEYSNLDEEELENLSIDDCSYLYYHAEKDDTLEVEGLVSICFNSDKLETLKISDDEAFEILRNANVAIDSIAKLEIGK